MVVLVEVGGKISLIDRRSQLSNKGKGEGEGHLSHNSSADCTNSFFATEHHQSIIKLECDSKITAK
eukprot:scaffold8850_cov113-Skeletonema_dohrnii-CCMP3373.AAC.3